MSTRRKYEGWNDLVILALLSLPVGAATGVIGGLFRLSLDKLDRWRLLAINWLHGWGHGWTAAAFVLVVVMGALSAGLAAWMVRRVAPHASGSGIPHTEAVLRGELPTEPYRLLPVKFFGGALAIGSGLALGREGPIVQMGSSLGHLVSDLFRRPWPDCRVLMAAGAGAGVATAFNAPIAGALFVLEELVQRFEHRIAIAALGASAAALVIAREMLGNSVEFDVPPLDTVSLAGEPLFLVLGAVMGLLAVAYNWLLLGTADMMQKARWLPLEARAGLIGAGVAVVTWFAPSLVGGGGNLTQEALAASGPLGLLPLVFLLRVVITPLSYAAGTPGGLFAPVLVLGAQGGLMFGTLLGDLLPGLSIPPHAFAVVGTAAFLTGVVRSPLTSIILIVEMTATVPMLLPMLGACFMAMLVPTLLASPPVYDELRERLVRRWGTR